MLQNGFEPTKIVYLCPSLPTNYCRWEGKANDIVEHFQESHKDLLIESNTFKADVSRNIQVNRLLPSEKGMFLLQTKVCVDSGKLWIRVRYLGSYNASHIRYSVEVISDKFAFTNLHSMEEYNPVFNVKHGVQVDIQAIALIRCMYNLKYVTVKIQINESENTTNSSLKEEHRDSVDSGRSSFTDFFDGEIVKEENSNFYSKWKFTSRQASLIADEEGMLKCTNCHFNMIPPIYMCPEGHSFCYNCKDNKCNVCELQITELRNIDLEEHSKTVEYPCRYQHYGCKQKLLYNELRKHEIYCNFFIYKCDQCVYQGKLYEIRSHYRIAHPSTKIYEAMTDIPFRKNANFLILNTNGVFYCTSRATEIYVEWKVIYGGPKERCFSCEVRLTGKKHLYYSKQYFLKRNDNIFVRSVPFDELKAANVKEKYATLFISSY